MEGHYAESRCGDRHGRHGRTAGNTAGPRALTTNTAPTHENSLGELFGCRVELLADCRSELRRWARQFYSRDVLAGGSGRNFISAPLTCSNLLELKGFDEAPACDFGAHTVDRTRRRARN